MIYKRVLNTYLFLKSKLLLTHGFIFSNNLCSKKIHTYFFSSLCCCLYKKRRKGEPIDPDPKIKWYQRVDSKYFIFIIDFINLKISCYV